MRPQSDGMVERFNRTLGTMLTAYSEKNQRTWDRYLALIMLAYRASVHASTGKTPAEMMFGRQLTMPLQAMIPQPDDTDDEMTSNSYVTDLRERLEEAHNEARHHLKKSAQYQKKNYDVRSSKRTFTVGDPVWVLRPTRKVGICSKLTSPWKGPCLVVERLDDVVYRVKMGRTTPPRVFHVDRLKKYKGRHLPRWCKPVPVFGAAQH